MDAGLVVSDIRIIDLLFAPDRDVRLQPYSGSVWRGAFGFALKRLVCVMRLRPCAGCPLASVCLFPRFFGSDPDHDEPRPYILAPQPTPPGGWLRAGEPFAVRLTLFAGAGDAAPYVVRALVDAAERGLTGERVPFRCLSLSAQGIAFPSAELGSGLVPMRLEPPPAPASVRLRFVTPLRLRLRGDLVTGRTLTVAMLAAAARRRARLLGIVFDEGALSEPMSEARRLAWQEPRLGWLETIRLSSRQGTRMTLGGIVGEARLDLRQSSAIWPLIWLASILHLGKGASMGFGRVELDAA